MVASCLSSQSLKRSANSPMHSLYVRSPARAAVARAVIRRPGGDARSTSKLRESGPVESGRESANSLAICRYCSRPRRVVQMRGDSPLDPMKSDPAVGQR